MQALNTDPLPVSALQHGMWLLEHVGGGQPLVRSALKISGPLDARRLERAIARVVERHELLCCGFRGTRGVVTRFLATPRDELLHVIDASPLSCADAQECMTLLRPHLEEVRLDLARAPLVRFVLIRMDAETAILWTAIHHIVCDEHSNAILCREILIAYAGRPFERPAGSFTQFLLREGDGQAAQTRREFWRRRLGDCDVSGPLHQMNRRFGAPASGPVTRSISHVLDREDEARIEQLCKAWRCTPTVLFLGLMQIWLARSSAGSCPPVCVPMQLRDDFDEDLMVGFLTNLVVIRSVFRDTDTATDFFRKLRTGFYEAWNNRQTPFTEVSAFFAGQRQVRVHPFSRYMLALETPPASLGGLEDLGLAIEPLRADTAIPGSDLALIVTRGASATALRVQYDASSVASAWAEGALAQILGLVRTLSEAPHARLANVSLPRETSGQGKHAAAPARRATVYRRFREMSQQLAGRAAIYADRTCSYSELSDRVDSLTALLLADGIRAGDMVGLALGRGVDLVAAQLAILRLGAAYVPMSPDWSPAVLAQIAGKLRQVLVDGSMRLALPEGCLSRTITDARVGLPGHFGEPEIPPGAIAYVLYTSGSTGEPKGVAVSHLSLECYIEWSGQYFGAPEDIVVCGCTPTIFDMSLSEVLVPPCTGMSTLLVSRPADAFASPHWNRVTWITGVPTVLRELLKSTSLPRAIRIVSFGGEELDRSIVERIRREAPAVRVLNLYGPTEITVYATGADLQASEQVDPVPIGRPLRFHDVRIVDSALNELPRWSVGQIVVGGPCVAAGYLGAAEATALKFVPDPFTDVPGARLHLTGDLGFADTEGRIHLVGRIDHQEKILGVRVHLGGVEAILRRHPDVADAACFVINKGGAAAYLAAALVGHSARTAPADELRAWMQQACTASHVPRQWVWFDRLPTRPGGKVDRAAVLADLEKALRAKRSVAASAEERAVLAVWRDVLAGDIEDVDVNFFDAGGNSLHLPRLCTELQAVGLTIDLPQVFEYPTVRAQARLMTRQRRPLRDDSENPLDAADSRGALVRGALARLGPAGRA